VLARAGFGSRRACEELIESGRVWVNGAPARLGQRVLPDRDALVVDGAPVGFLPDLVYYLLNKPIGVVSTASDPEGRRTVVQLVPSEPRVHPVGRLDVTTEGLLILTNDGEFTNLLTHPRFGIEKEYLAEVNGDPTPGELRRLRDGVEIEPGRMSAPAKVARRGPELLRVVVHEGRYHEVRRMCEAIGHPVRRLVRTRIGTLVDPTLRPGRYREIALDEVRALSASATSAAGVSRSERRRLSGITRGHSGASDDEDDDADGDEE
jgi:23S rRNA pseudouridine2605 synthase